ncbi:uncharacterized protein B0P05DRAFT_302834 [Gilbertella persicaria]|uniref:uncharacterized protein n=1 Tax=Gilbertella persicaria TaxID=101096 RepID=UPI002220077B|nr:uncharacterized protein B0P05DRAFT_302834 [Gilbertella persicaria]KAI8054142.1 hypothetical protein B0P05DRAFT_302834 [Gilbertella persicaria]
MSAVIHTILTLAEYSQQTPLTKEKEVQGLSLEGEPVSEKPTKPKKQLYLNTSKAKHDSSIRPPKSPLRLRGSGSMRSSKQPHTLPKRRPSMPALSGSIELESCQLQRSTSISSSSSSSILSTISSTCSSIVPKTPLTPHIPISTEKDALRRKQSVFVEEDEPSKPTKQVKNTDGKKITLRDDEDGKFITHYVCKHAILHHTNW